LGQSLYEAVTVVDKICLVSHKMARVVVLGVVAEIQPMEMVLVVQEQRIREIMADWVVEVQAGLALVGVVLEPWDKTIQVV
jgi:hypothetical protein